VITALVRLAPVLFGLLALFHSGVGRADETGASGMKRIEAGTYTPFYPLDDEPTLAVAAFLLDEAPVSNAQFREFVREHPRWQRSRAPSLFRDDAYLSHWESDEEPGSARSNQPATFVSYFAASAYCRSAGKRLPTEAEWEWAASPDPADPRSAAEITSAILAFYAQPRGAVGATPPNRYGVRDLHGVIWEWVGDFNGVLANGDNRQDADPELERFCGGSSIGADDVKDYATFMRFAFRSSLEARYALHHLGFRCARSL
jgi:formylglycine-generating enzyme required for sulfatase activity